ncbi:hypothetical protein OHC33_000320 [Knufia fluminis]|uniref:Uncharacterized protein n=1 Tax=Knufia fluminis TaxID=191047 RepID=A0AAN8ISS3_9EURO|nr:hypothetical protein OHC33_000320 [Knufia fluminis]
MSTHCAQEISDRSLNITLSTKVKKFIFTGNPTTPRPRTKIPIGAIKNYSKFGIALRKFPPEFRYKLLFGRDITDFRNGRQISREEKRELIGMFEAVEGEMERRERVLVEKGKRKRWRKKGRCEDGEDEMSG